LPHTLLQQKSLRVAKSPLLDIIDFDDSSFEIFFKENFSCLCVYCQCKFGFELDQAKEIVHIAFIKLWENRHTISADSSIKAYMCKIITNVSYDNIRHDKVKQKHEKHVIENFSVSYNKNDFDKTELKQLRNDIDKAVSELPDQMRKIFEMSRYEGLKYSEISSRLTISVKTVETQMSRALVKLRQKLFIYLTLYLLILLLSAGA
jgi:RNA polymerase sigma-70 factor, ECF subfamily